MPRWYAGTCEPSSLVTWPNCAPSWSAEAPQRYDLPTCSGAGGVMTAGPGDDKAATGNHGHMRLSAADRERVIDVLKAAFVEERLTKDELDVRVGQAYSSQTYAELAAVTADLPAGSAGTPAGQPAGTLAERPPLGPAKKAVLMTVALTLQPA